jgi:hypothetical protein
MRSQHNATFPLRGASLLRQFHSLAAVALISLVVATNDVAAQPPDPVPASAPEIAMATAGPRETIRIYRYVERLVSNLEYEVESTERKPSLVEARTFRTVCRQESEIAVAQISARCVNGRKLDQEALLSRITKPVAVLLIVRGQEVEPVFLQLAKPNTVILELPERPATAIGWPRDLTEPPPKIPIPDSLPAPK